MNMFLSGWQTTLPTQGCKQTLQSEQETNGVSETHQEGSGEQVRSPAKAGTMRGLRRCNQSSREENSVLCKKSLCCVRPVCCRTAARAPCSSYQPPEKLLLSRYLWCVPMQGLELETDRGSQATADATTVSQPTLSQANTSIPLSSGLVFNKGKL